MGRLGGWGVTLPDQTVRWTPETLAIYELDDEVPDVEAGLGFYVEEHRPIVAAAVQRCIETGAPFDVEVELITAKGRRIWVRAMGEARRDESGAVVELQGALQDISEHKAVELSLKRSEERFRLLGRATHDAIWDWTPSTGELWWNDAFESFFGVRPNGSATLTELWEQRVHPEDRERVLTTVRTSIAEGASDYAIEHRFVRPDGTVATVLSRGYVLRDLTGRPVRLIGGMTDVTERKRAEERIAEQAELLEHAQDAIVVRELDGSVRYVNRRAEELYGWRRDEMLGVDARSLHFASSVDEFENAQRLTLSCGEWRGDLEQRRRDGTKLLVEGRWTLLRHADGTPRGILAVNTEVGERRRLEQIFLRTQRLESVGTLAGGIAHDLNNVLTPIVFATEVLRASETDPARATDLETIAECAHRGTAMITQLLTFARGYRAGRAVTALDRVVSDVARIGKETFPRDIVWTVDAEPGLWSVRGDVSQLHQVVLNLCLNARDAMPQGGALRVILRNVTLDELFAGMNPDAKPGRYVVLRVEDSGHGMPPHVVERIFEPFFTTKEAGKGTGLGLSTVHAIVKAHHGFVRAYSEVGRGTVLVVHLPASDDVAEIDSPPTPARHVELPRGQGELVLVVDDEAPIRAMLQRTLERFGYRVLCAAHGAEAIALFVTHRDSIDVVMTDMAMPVMDGAALAVALRTMDADLPIVAASGLDTSSKVAAARDSGVRHFITKPYSAETVLRVLRDVLKRA